MEHRRLQNSSWGFSITLILTCWSISSSHLDIPHSSGEKDAIIFLRDSRTRISSEWRYKIGQTVLIVRQLTLISLWKPVSFLHELIRSVSRIYFQSSQDHSDIFYRWLRQESNFCLGHCFYLINCRLSKRKTWSTFHESLPSRIWHSPSLMYFMALNRIVNMLVKALHH
jgi:hypothetical protein